MEDYYQMLGVSPDASPEVVKERFHFLALAYHPDRFANSTHQRHAEEAFKKISEAYHILSHPAKRAQYDRRRSSSDARYVEERRRREEAEAARQRAEQRAAEERYKREEAEAAGCRAQEEQLRKEQATRQQHQSTSHT